MSVLLESINTIWILVAAALVFFMQAGFAMVEAGLTRIKSTGNIIMKNLMDFALGTLVFWLFGFGIMHGKDLAGIIGLPSYEWMLHSNADYTAMIFQTVFCATASTIDSGAMAERTKFSSYCVYSVVISLIIYPVSGHWIWGGGWLSELGFHDFAGSTAVHMVGGIAALVGAKMVGPRIGKYGKDGKPRAIPGHNLAMAALGVFILWFCWFGFNGGSIGDFSTLTESFGGKVGQVFFTTNMAAAAGATVCMIITWVRYKKPDVSMCLNGALAGLVVVTAGADTVTAPAALIIGAVAGIIVTFGIEFLDKKAKIDDPVGAIAVHGFCGAAGTVMTGIFSNEYGLWAAAQGTVSWAEGFTFFGVQILGVVAVAAWVFATITLTFFAIKKTMGLRVSAAEEIKGLDISEHNLETAYAGFTVMDFTDNSSFESSYEVKEETKTEAIAPAPSSPEQKSPEADRRILTRLSMVIKQNKFEELKEALNSIGVSGMTVTQVMGCGMQKGHTEYYRGAPVPIMLWPKVKVDVVVSAVPVEKVVETAKRVLNTNSIGDGKIFVYDIENVIKVRTGEEGFDALQDDK